MQVLHFHTRLFNCIPKTYICKEWGQLTELPPVHYIAAELDDAKRSLLQDRYVPQMPLQHLFSDLAKLPDSWDYIEKRIVHVDRVDFLCCGFPCVDVSPLKRKQIPFQPKQGSVTADVFHEVLHLVAMWLPECILLENVVGILRNRKCDTESPWETMCLSIVPFGFCCQRDHSCRDDCVNLCPWRVLSVPLGMSVFSPPLKKVKTVFFPRRYAKFLPQVLFGKCMRNVQIRAAAL